MANLFGGVSPYLHPSPFTNALLDYFLKNGACDTSEDEQVYLDKNDYSHAITHNPDGTIRKNTNFKTLSDLEAFRRESGEFRFEGLIDIIQQVVDEKASSSDSADKNESRDTLKSDFPQDTDQEGAGVPPALESQEEEASSNSSSLNSDFSLITEIICKLIANTPINEESIQLLLLVLATLEGDAGSVEKSLLVIPPIFRFDPKLTTCVYDKSHLHPNPHSPLLKRSTHTNSSLINLNIDPLDLNSCSWMYTITELVVFPHIYNYIGDKLDPLTQGLQFIKELSYGNLALNQKIHFYSGLLSIATRAFPDKQSGLLSRIDSTIVFKSESFRKLVIMLLQNIDQTSCRNEKLISIMNSLLRDETNPLVAPFYLPFVDENWVNNLYALPSEWNEFGQFFIRYLEQENVLDGDNKIKPNVLEELIQIVTKKIENFHLWSKHSIDYEPFQFHRAFAERIVPILIKNAEDYPNLQPSSAKGLPYSIRYILKPSLNRTPSDHISEQMLRLTISKSFSDKNGADSLDKDALKQLKLGKYACENLFRIAVNKFYYILRIKWTSKNLPFFASLVGFGNVVALLLSRPDVPAHMQSVYLLLALTYRALSSQVVPLRELGRSIISFLTKQAFDGEKQQEILLKTIQIPYILCFPVFYNKIKNFEKDVEINLFNSNSPLLNKISMIARKLLIIIQSPSKPVRSTLESGIQDGIMKTPQVKPPQWTDMQLTWDENKTNKLHFIEYLAQDLDGGAIIALELLKNVSTPAHNTPTITPSTSYLNLQPSSPITLSRGSVWDDILETPFPFQFVYRMLYIVESAKGIPAYRSLFKILGSWLGSVTLAKNKPILTKQLDLKTLLISGYHRGLLIAILPFVCKVLECVKESKIFKPPNPWTSGLLNTLVYLYRLPRLKTNRIFEIELLFKSLGLNSPKNWDYSVPPTPINVTPVTQADFDSPLITPSEPVRHVEPAIRITSEVLSRIIVIPENVDITKAAVGQAIERAIKEISPIIERSVSTGIKSARQLLEQSSTNASLIAKTIPEKMFRYLGKNANKRPTKLGLCILCHSLAHSLSAVSARVMLNSLLLDNVFSILRNTIDDVSEAKLYASMVVSANIDSISKLMSQLVQSLLNKLGGGLIDLSNVDPQEASGINLDFLPGRKNAVPWRVIEQPVPQAPQTSQTVPLITTFTDEPFQVPPVSGLATNVVLKKFAECSTHIRKAVSQIITFPPVVPPLKASTDQFSYVKSLVAFYPVPNVENSALGLLASLPSDHQIFYLVESVRYLCRNAANKPEIYHTIGTKLLKSGNEAILQAEKSSNPKTIDQSAIILEIELAIFELLCVDWPGLRTLTSSFVMVPTYMNVNRVTLFVRFNLINLDTLDKFLAAHLDNSQGVNANAVEFTIRVLHKLIVEHGYASCHNFSQCITKLTKVSSRGLAHKRTNIGSWSRMDLPEAKNRVLRECKNALPQTDKAISSLTTLLKEYSIQGRLDVIYPAIPVPVTVTEKARQSAVALFIEWLSISNNGNETEYLKKLSRAGCLRLDDVTDAFFTSSLYLALYVAYSGPIEYKNPAEYFERADIACKIMCDVFQNGAPLPTLRQPDLSYICAWARLATRMITLVDSNHISPIIVLLKLLHIVCKVIHKSTSLGVFVVQQRGFYRLFDYIIRGILHAPSNNEAQGTLEPQQMGLLQAVSSALITVSPLRIPAFAYSWIQLLSRLVPHFISTQLIVKRRSGNNVVSLSGPHLWEPLSQLFIHLFEFISNITTLEGQEFRLIYDSTLILMTFIYNRAAEFFAAYALKFNEVLTGELFQIRNIICSSVPAILPNSNEGVNEWGNFRPPIISTVRICGITELKTAIDAYFFANGGKEHVLRISNTLTVKTSEGSKIDVNLLNQTILYVGMIIPKYSGEGSLYTARRLILELAGVMDIKGKNLLVICLMNHLRYKCKVTSFFHELMLDLFCVESSGGTMQEIMLKSILARNIPSGPKPYGLKQLVQSLIKSPKIDLWKMSLVNAVPAIKQLFEQVLEQVI